MQNIQLPCELNHATLERCFLKRIEGVIWIVSVKTIDGIELRIPPARRNEFSIVGSNGRQAARPHRTDTSRIRPASPVNNTETSAAKSRLVSQLPSNVESAESRADVPAVASPPSKPRSQSVQQLLAGKINPLQRRLLKRGLESLRTGLPPQDPALSRYFSVGLEPCFKEVKEFLRATRDGGSAMVIRGAYGCGKTLTLQTSQFAALHNNFVFSETEIDASEVRLDRSPTIYSTLLQKMKFPDGGCGVEHLLTLVHKWFVESDAPSQPKALYEILNRRIQCEPLAWLLSDRDIVNKPSMLQALRGVPMSPARLRGIHPLPNVRPNWPYFKYGTQGDVGSFLISGIARLLTLIGYGGWIVALDEMEKWQDVNLTFQDRASSLLGGLIWSAFALEGDRDCKKTAIQFDWDWTCDHSDRLKHGRFAGGSPFTTRSRCNLGIIIAMTPRGQAAPELAWREFGDLRFVDLPGYQLTSFHEHFDKVAVVFRKIYDDIEIPPSCKEKAEHEWRNTADHSPRSAAIAIFGALSDLRGI